MSERTSARLTRQSGTSFYYAFRILPADKRQAIYALYSFCRVADDCVDEPRGEGEAGLKRWLEEVDRCYAGRPATELGRDLAEALRRFAIPRSCFEDIVAGCRMDLTISRYATFRDLRIYCERVASSVGLACIEIFGYRNPSTRDYAVELGVALQLTNILRDVSSDGARGRIYIPLEDLERFGVRESELLAAAESRASREGRQDPRITELIAFQADRARTHYARAEGLLPGEDRKALRSAEIMGGIYRAILDEIARRGYRLSPDRVRLTRARKMWIGVRTLVRARRGA